MTFYSRGVMRLYLKEWEQAKADLTTAKNMGLDIIAFFRNFYASVANFESRIGFALPDNITAMLTPPQA